MRVLQLGKFYYPYMGGIENHLYILCNELKRTHSLEVVVSNTKPETERSVVSDVPVTRCAELTNISSTSICPSMPWVLSRSSYDIMHMHFPHPMGVMSYLGSRTPKRHGLIVTYHSDIVRQERLKKLFDPFMHAVLKKADAIIATSPNYRDTSETLRPYLGKCEVIPYGIDLSLFQRTADSDRRAAEIKKKYAGPLTICVGRLIYYKGFEHLIRAMAKVEGQLLLIGDGPLRTGLESLARTVGVADRVHFLGEVHNNDITPYYFAADVFALPSIARSEAFAIVQLEAMACGLPVVNTSLDSGVPFVSRDGESGATVKPGDHEALASALGQLLGDPTRCRELGENGRRRVHAEFSKEVMTRRITGVYDSILSRYSARRMAS